MDVVDVPVAIKSGKLHSWERRGETVGASSLKETGV